MTCTNVRRMHGKVETPAKPRNGRIVIGVLLAVLLVCVAIGVALHLRNISVEQQTQVQLRDDFVAELERNEGTYDAQSIVLYETSRAKAEELAEKLGASLRMTKDGSFATLTLPEGTTILDVCRDEENIPYVEQMSADYQVSISELIEGEEDEEGNDERLPMRPTYTVSDTDYDKQTYLDYMNMQNVWASYTGWGVTIAVIDTGIDTDHPEFAGRISEYSYNATEDKIVKDYVLENGEYDWSLVEDEQGHGTAVTGVIAASMNSGNVVGIAPNVTIITIKAECDEFGRFQRVSDLVFGLYYAIERDVSVVNMSFGVSDNVFGEATQLAYDSDVICVAAAGNDSTAALTYPAADPLVIGVGALAEDSWELAEYSNYGENVNVVAPGTTYTSLMGGGYGSMDGTSLACPAVTGLIALYMQTHKYVMFDQVTEELYASCYDLGDLGCDWYFGFGAVDANAFLIEERGTVTYDMLTDEVDDIEGTFIRGHALQELPEPDRLYAIFDGWYYDEHCTQRVEYYTDAFYGDITLYASWVNEDDGIPFTYVILDDGTVEIRSYTGHRRFITIPEKIEGRVVSSIGDFAFQGETNLREVGLPSGLRHIGLSAFAGCANLVSMYIPENVTEIEESAFAECVRLSTIAFTGQSKLLSIGDYAFSACGKLRTIELPATLQSINGTAFVGTSALTSIHVQSGNQYFKSEDGVLFDISGETLIAYPAAHGTTYEIPESVKTVGDFAFYGAKVIFLDLGQIQTIGEFAFAFSSVLSVNIPDTVTAMRERVFASSAVRELHIGAGLDDIAPLAFADCSGLTTVRIPEGITVIEEAAFMGCDLQSVIFAENGHLSIIADNAFADNSLTEVHIPASVEYIGSICQKPHGYDYFCRNKEGAFEQNDSLRRVTFADQSQLKVIGDRAFAYCALRDVALPEGVVHLGAGAFWTNPLEAVTIPASVEVLQEAVFGYRLDLGVPVLTHIDVAEGNSVFHDVDGVVYSLDNTELYAFPVGRGGEYSLPDTVRKIMPLAFAGTVHIDRIILPEGLTEIGSYAFSACGAYTYELPSTLRYIKNGGFYANFRLNSITLPEGLEQIAEYAFYECAQLPTIHIPDSVMQIGRYAFAMDWNLYSVTFNETAKLPRISLGAFAYCGLETFRVPANVSTIAQGAFKECYKLTSFTFAENSKLESISAYMFDGCTNLQTITFERGSALTSVQAHALEGMDKLTQINWGEAKVTNIDNFAFRFCESLSELTLPDTVTNVGRYAFYGCKSLSELTLPESLEHIGMFAFLGTKDLNLYLKSDTLPAYLDEDWDHGIRGYYVGVTNVVTDGDYKYATLTSSDVSIIEYLGSDIEIDLTALNFGAPITGIGGSAFEDKGIVRVTLPETLTSIQAEAFAYNPLEDITIPAGVTFIGREAFTYTEIASLTFAEGSQIQTIEQYAFERTRNLTEVTLPASLTTMGRGVFQESGLTSVTFEEGIALERIPENAFTQTKLTSIALPDGVNYVDHNAFREIPTLQSVTFGNAENISLQSNSFYHTGLTSLHIPANVTYIGEYSFVALSNLTEITVDENNPWYKSEDGLLLSKDGRKLIVVPAGRTGSLTVPVSVEMLGFGAFEESKLSEVKFDPNANILTLGYRAFFKANNITSIDIPKSVISIDYYAFAYCENLQTVNFAEYNQLKGIYEGAFLGDIRLENITIPDTIVEISDFAFYGCSGIDRIPISENNALKGIYSYAFAYTGIAGELTLPETLIDIGDYAFLGIRVTKVTVPTTNQRDMIIGLGAFEECNKLEEISLPFIGASLDDMQYSWLGYIFGAGAYEANAIYVPVSLKTVTIADGQTVVGDGGFAYLANLEAIHLPHSICVVYTDAFRDTYAKYELTNTIMVWHRNYMGVLEPQVTNTHFGGGITGHLELAGACVLDDGEWTDGVTEITLGFCHYLTSITIPNTVTRIPKTDYCSRLQELIVREDHPRFEAAGGILYDKIEKQLVCVPKGITGEVEILEGTVSIRESAFSGCHDLTKITIPTSLTTIGQYAFRNCWNLQYIVNRSDLPLQIGSDLYGELAYYAEFIEDKNGNVTGIENIFFTEDGFKYQKTKYGYYLLIGYSGTQDPLTLPADLEGKPYVIGQMNANVRHIIIPEGVTVVQNQAFWGCKNLETVTVCASEISFGYAAFRSESLQRIEIASENARYYVVGNCLIDKQTQTLIRGFEDSVIPADGSVTAIGTEAFMYCDGLTGLIIPDSVKQIGDSAFYGCESLKQIILPDGVTKIGELMFRYCNSLESLTIPASVDQIDPEVLNKSSLQNIVISPENPKYYVIGNCLIDRETKTLIRGLNDCVIPADGSVVTIGAGAFSQCKDMQAVVVPGSVSRIDKEAFYGCVSLQHVVLENGVTSIGADAFYGCTRLTSVTIPASVQSLDIRAFPENTQLQYAGEQPFCVIDGIMYNGALTQIIQVVDKDIKIARIPDGVTEIGDSVFMDCALLTQVIIPDSVTRIGNYAFYNCASLTSISFSSEINSIGHNVFGKCYNLSGITVANENSKYHSTNNCIIETATNTLIVGCYASKIPSDGSVTAIGDYAFAECGMYELVIPDCVERIGTGAFQYSTHVTLITVGSGVTDIDYWAFEGVTPFCIVNRSDLPLKIGSGQNGAIAHYARILIDQNGNHTYGTDGEYFCTAEGFFYQIKNGAYELRGYIGPLDTIILPDILEGQAYRIREFQTTASYVILPQGITTIDDNAFNGCENLLGVTIPNSVTSIGRGAFSGCSNLVEIVLPSGLTDVGDRAFRNCSNLVSLHIPSGVTDIGTNAFDGCVSLSHLTVSGENVRYEAIDGVLYDKQAGLIVWVDVNISGAIVIPDYVTQIGPKEYWNNGGAAFTGCTGLTDITIPDSVTILGYQAFAECTGLTNITIPDSVKFIGESAFANCTALTSITVPDSVTVIRSRAFYGCSALTDISIPKSIINVQSDAFIYTGYYNDSENWVDGALALDGMLLVLNPDAKYMDAFAYDKVAQGVYDQSVLLKNAILGGSLSGADNVETLVIKDIANAGLLNVGSAALPITLKQIVITKDVDVTELLSNMGIFKNVSGVTIYVERNEKDLRWDTNFPGWNYGNRVIYGENWSWTTFYDQDGNILIQQPRLNTNVILKPIIESTEDDESTYEWLGWDLNGDGIADGLPAAMGSDLNARPVYLTLPKEYVIVFKDSETGEIYQQELLQYGELITPPSITPTCDGGYFIGWAGYAEGMTVVGDAEISAVWHLHDYRVTVIAPTCTQQGYTEHRCSCGDTFATNVQDALEHDIGDWYPSVIPTCLAGGENRRECSRCDLVETQVVPANGHQYESFVTEPTCTARGYTKYVCHCGDTYTGDYVDALGHNMGEWYPLTWPGCTTKGKNRSNCTRCSYYVTETVPALGHTPGAAEEENRVEPGCFGDGGYDIVTYCTVCSRVVSREHITIPTTGHDMGEWYLAVAPTCTVEGEEHRVCAGCGGYEVNIIPTIGHTPDSLVIEVKTEATCTKVGGYDEVVYCVDCGEEMSRDHIETAALGHIVGEWYCSVAPACKAEGENRRDCERGCGYYETEVVPATGHTPADTVEENRVAPTCTEIGGYDTVVYCSVCNAELSREHVEIPAVGHNPADAVEENRVAPTCTETGRYDNVVYCTVCGEELNRETIVVDALGHDMGEWYQTIAPTCTTEGENRSDCARCDYYETETVDALGHTEADAVEENHIDPTCTEIGGYDMVVYCAVCGAEVSREHYDIDALGHNMGEWYQTIAPTCTEDGQNKRDCGRCDYFETEVVPANGHTPADAVEENHVDPTCTEIGGYDMVVYCSVCGVELSREHYDIDALGHTVGEWYQTVAPTCTEEGQNKRDCGRDCGYYETEVVPANGHTPANAVEENHVDPTCTEIGGYDMVVYCTVCDVELSREHTVLEALGHSPADAVEENHIDPTCTEIGSYDMTVYCTVCATELSREHYEIEALGHTPADAVGENHVDPTCTEIGGYDMVVYCSVCDVELSREHADIPANGHTPAEAVEENRVAPTCTEIGGYDMAIYCTDCSIELSREHYDVEATGHSHNAVVTAPTCTEQGYTTHTCHCGDAYVDSYVNALGHTEAVTEAVAPTCTATGLTEGKHCSVCNEILVAQEVVPANGHTYEAVVTAPTCTEKGYTTHTCHCGDSYVDSEVDALGHTPSDWIVDAEAQIGVEGSKHKECTTCGETLEIEAIEALPEEPSGGCNGTISASVVLLALLSCFAVAWRPRKDN